MNDAAHIAPGTLLAGKFRVLRLLGAGGMGAVYEIEHDLTKHRRALKMLHAQFRAYPAVVARFLREASAAGRIGNPHIIETFDAGEFDTGEPYLVMEYLEGHTLSDALGAKGTLPIDELANILVQACEGVQAAHDAGIIHRDLKPDNLFLVERDGKPFVKILDFGVSKFDAELTGGMGMTKEGSTLGTPFYMPPEQVRGEKNLDARADVYALGVILYECASGRRPYEAETLPHLALLIHEGKAHPLAELRPDLPASFVEIAARAMASDRGQRYPTARALAEALLPFADGALGQTMIGGAEAGGQVVIKTSGVPTAALSGDRSPSAFVPTMHGATVSVSEEPPKRSSKAGVIAGGAAALVVAGAAAAFFLRGAPPGPPTAPSAAAAIAAAPALTAANPAPPATASAAASASAAVAPTGLGAPALAPRVPPRAPGTPGTQGGVAAVAATPAAPATTPPTAAPPPRRSDQKGLAADNPFK